MQETSYECVLNKTPYGFTLHKVVKNRANNPVNLRFAKYTNRKTCEFTILQTNLSESNQKKVSKYNLLIIASTNNITIECTNKHFNGQMNDFSSKPLIKQ